MIIKLNFLPKEEKKKFVIRISWAKVFIFFLIIIITSLLSTFVGIDNRVSSFQNQKKYLLKEKNKYRKLIKKINELKKENEEIKTRIETIIKLKEKRGYAIKILDNILLSVPLGKIYLTSLELNSSFSRVSGFAIDYENVAAFLKNLENKKDIFKDINLQYTKQKKVKGYNVIEFRLSITY